MNHIIDDETFALIEKLDEFHNGIIQNDAKLLNSLLVFSITWGLFERRILELTTPNFNTLEPINRNLNVEELKKAAHLKKAPLNLENAIKEAFSFWKKRYFGASSTNDFYGLHFRKADKEDEVRKIFEKDTANEQEQTEAALIICYRFRNNLFHGTKWAGDISDQADNMVHAAKVMIAFLERKID